MNIFKKIAYSVGGVSTSLSYQAFSTYILFFYVDYMKLKPTLAAIAMVIYGIWNAINDPIAGYISDRTKTKWGRRIPYIMFGSIPFGIVYFLMWSPPFSSENMIALFFYFLIFICLFDGFYSFVVLNWVSLFPEMFESLKERAQVNSFRQFFGVLGLIVGMGLPPLIYSKLGFSWMGAIFAFLIVFVLLFSLLGCREKGFYYKKDIGVFEAFSETLKSRSFLIFVISNLLIQYSFTIVPAAIPFYAKYVLGVGPKETSTILLSAFLIELPFLFFWSILASRFGAKPVYMVAIACFIIFLFPFLFIKSLIPAIITSCLLGFSLGGVIVLSDVIIADIIDEDETKTKMRREGAFFGVNAFICRFAIALEAISMGLVFTLSGYNPYLIFQKQSFLFGLRLLISVFPMVAMFASLIIMYFYPLHGSRLLDIRNKILEIRSKS